MLLLCQYKKKLEAERVVARFTLNNNDNNSSGNSNGDDNEHTERMKMCEERSRAMNDSVV